MAVEGRVGDRRRDIRGTTDRNMRRKGRYGGIPRMCGQSRPPQGRAI